MVDVVIGGSPCQDLSVAGKRAGLEGERSGLFMEQIRVIKEMRAHDRSNGRTGQFVRPRYMVWENVPGAFSSGKPKGADFQAVLEETTKIVCRKAPPVPIPKDGWPSAGCISGVGDSGIPFSIAWRVHDAQFWGSTQYADGRMLFPGTPQRRKRIALVADFNGLTAPEILFVRESSAGHYQSGGTEREEAAGSAAGSTGEAGKCLNGWDVQSKHIQQRDGKAETLYSGECRYGGGESYVFDDSSPSDVGIPDRGFMNEPVLLESSQDHATVRSDGVSTTLPASAGIGGGYVPMVTGFTNTGYGTGNITETLRSDHHGAYPMVAGTLDASYYKGPGERNGVERDVVVSAGFVADAGANMDLGYADELSPSLATRRQEAIVYGISGYDSNAMKSDNPNSGIYEADTSRTLDLNGGNPSCNQGGMAVVQGADMYNHTLTGDIAVTLNASSCNSPTHSGPTVVCIEGNGSRESHRGDGYKESEVMYTLNTTEQHAIAVEQHTSAYGVVSKGNGECFLTPERHMSLSTGGGQAGQGMPCVMVEEPQTVLSIHEASGRDVTVKNDVAYTLSAGSGIPGQGLPCIMVEEPHTVLAVHEADGQDVTVQDEVAYSLVTGGGKPGQGYPCVMVKSNENTSGTE